MRWCASTNGIAAGRRGLLLLPVLLVAAMRAQAPLLQNVVRLDPGGNGGDKPTFVSDGSVLHAFWFGASHSSLVYNRSVDGGRSWLPLERVLLTGNIASFTADQDVLYIGLMTGGGPAVVSSHDAGITWSAPVLVSALATATARVVLHAGLGVLTAVWDEPRTGPGEVYFNRSFDGGQTWQPTDTQLDTALPIGPSATGRVVRDGTTIHVQWFEGQAQGSVAYARSPDLGSTWSPAQLLTSNQPGFLFAGAGSVVLVALRSSLLRSTDTGATWAPVSLPIAPGAFIFGAQAAGNLVLVFSGTPLQCHRSLDGGSTWSPSTFVSTFPPPGVAYDDAQAAITGNTITAALQFWPSCCFIWNAYLWQSQDAGLTWRFELTCNGQASAVATPYGHVAGFGGSTGGPADPRAALVTGFAPYGGAKAGTGSVAPALSGSGIPALGATVAILLQQARGGSLAAIGASLAGPANLQGFVLDPGAADGFASTAGLEMWML